MKKLILAALLSCSYVSIGLADTTTLSSPGLTLSSDIDHIKVNNVSYDSDGRVTGSFRVTKTNGQFRNVSARFNTAADAYNYAAAVNAQAGGYDVSNYGSGLVVKNSPKNIKPLPTGVAGIVVQKGPAYVVGGGTLFGKQVKSWGTVTMRTVYHDDGSCTGYCGGDKAPTSNQNAAKVSQMKGGIGVKGGGANYGHAVSK